MNDAPQDVATAQVEALRAARQALDARDAGAVESVHQIASSLQTASTSRDVRAAALAVVKASGEELALHVENLLAALGDPVAATAAETGLLIVTADTGLSRQLRQSLSHATRVLFVADTGAQAEKVFESQVVSLILVDLAVPDMNGLTLLARLREHPDAAAVPVLALTDSGDTQQATECFALGADAVFTKPVDLQTLTAAVTAKLQRAESLAHEARRDTLTGLPNRAAFQEALDRGLARSARTDRSLTVAVLDLDHFKGINDTYGHAMGDEVLRRAGKLVGGSLRTSDLLARWGGEEFVALFPETDQDSASRVLERALHALRSERFETEDGRAFHVTFSAGVCETSADLSAEGAVGKADELLYVAKSTGRNRVVAGQPGSEEMPSTAPGRDAPRTEHRQLTVLELRLWDEPSPVSSTSLSETTEVLQAARDACQEVVQRFQAHVAEVRSAGLQAYFGYPLAHEDDAQRAVQAGMAVIEAVGGLSARFSLDGDHTLNVSVGIHTGPVTVSAGGGGSEPFQAGKTQYVAAQMQKHAGFGAVLMSAATARIVQGYFECEELGVQPVPRAMAVYRVLSERGAGARGDTAAGNTQLPLAGRNAELALLQDRWEQVKEGMGQAVLLTGEAGIGKSRLVGAVRRHAADTAHVRFDCCCMPYHQNTALHLVVGLLQRILDFAESDTAEAQLEKLERALKDIGFDVRETAPLLAALLSLQLPDGRSAPSRLSAQQQKQKVLEAVLAIILDFTNRQPVLVVLEDLHWVDPSSLEFLTQLIDQAATVPLCILLTFRPAFRPPWSIRAHLTQITLSRLPRSQIDEMVLHITHGKRLPAEVHEHVVAKTDGVPLFVEELTKMVLESDLLVEEDGSYALTGPLTDLAIPTTLHDSLMARLDRLGSAKSLAQFGAVVGRTFSYRLLEEVSQFEEPALRRELERLVGAELLYQRHVPPESTYTFKHALIQETAYQSLVSDTRALYHARTAGALEEHFPDVVRGEPEVLAHHYTGAGNAERAVAYWIKAGRRAIDRCAYVEGLADISTGLQLLESTPVSAERNHRELQLQTMRAAALQATRGFGAAETGLSYARARTLCAELDNAAEIFPVLHGVYLFHMLRGEVTQAGQVAEECLRRAQAQGDIEPLLFGHRSMGSSMLHLGKFAVAREHLTQALELAATLQRETSSSVYGIDPRTAAPCFLSMTLFALGYPDQAAELADGALERARELGHFHNLGYALYWANLTGIQRRDLVEVLARAEQLKELGEEQSFAQWAAFGTFQRGWALAGLGEPDQGIEQMRRGIEDYLALGSILYLPLMRALLASALAEQGLFEQASSNLDAALAQSKETRELWFQPELYRLMGELVRQDGTATWDEAEAMLQNSLAMARAQGARAWELRTTVSLARLRHHCGERNASLDSLAGVYGWYTEGLGTSDLVNARALLAELGR